MKHLYLGLGILLGVLLSALLALGLLSKSLGATEDSLEQAWLACQREAYGEAEAHAQEAARQWEKSHGLAAALLDHSPLEEGTRLLAQLEAASAQKDWGDFGKTCREFLALVQVMAEGEKPLYYNIL